MLVDFRTDPSRYRHWKIAVDGDTAALIMNVDAEGGLFPGYSLKLNSYDLGVDIELNDAIQRFRFEYPGVKVVVLKSGQDKVFCAGANIRMLAGSTHAHKVNFCKFTNETRNGMEEASENSGLKFICAIKGTAAGGGYELALATDYIILADDGNSTVSLPELPLLAVLPGTGGLTRVTDKRRVRRDLADVFCTTEEGVKGKRAVQWRLVDETAPNSKFDEVVKQATARLAATSNRPAVAQGVTFTPLARQIDGDAVVYSTVRVDIERAARRATITVMGPSSPVPVSADAMLAEGDQFWPLRCARELEDAILHLRLNELDIGVWIFKTVGDAGSVVAYDTFLAGQASHWLAREITNYWKRTLKRIDVTSRSLVALITPGSCFAGTLAEIAFACDRSYMLAGTFPGDNRSPAVITLTATNFGPYLMSNDLTRLGTRFLGTPESVEAAQSEAGRPIDADAAEALGLVTQTFEHIDWDDEIRIFLEERASFSADGLTGLEANLRFPGPETMETRIFGRLTAWQNWIFQRPNAAGDNGALKRYGTGQKAEFNRDRI